MEIREGKEAPGKEISGGNELMHQDGEKEGNKGHRVMLKEERGGEEVVHEGKGG